MSDRPLLHWPDLTMEQLQELQSWIEVWMRTKHIADARPAIVGGGISEITSTDMTVTITDPTGPTVDLSAPGGGGGSNEVAYAETPTTINVTATTSASPTTVLTLPSVTLDGNTDVRVILQCPSIGLQNCNLYVGVYDNGTFVGYMSQGFPFGTGDVANATFYVHLNAVAQLRGTDRPAAGAHVFSIRAHKDPANFPSPQLISAARGTGDFLPIWASAETI